MGLDLQWYCNCYLQQSALVLFTLLHVCKLPSSLLNGVALHFEPFPIGIPLLFPLFSYVSPFTQEGGKTGGPNTLEYSLHVILLTQGLQCHRVLMILLTLKGNFIVLVLLQRVH